MKGRRQKRRFQRARKTEKIILEEKRKEEGTDSGNEDSNEKRYIRKLGEGRDYNFHPTSFTRQLRWCVCACVSICRG